MPAITKKNAAAAVTLEPGVVAQLPLAAVDFDPDQPRKDIDAAYIAELAADIKQRGVMQPITVRANPDAPGRYIIKYGECRYRASSKARTKTIPALLDTEAARDEPLARLLDQVKENHIRRDLNPMEWAGVLRRMRQHGVKSIADVEKTLKAHGITNMGRSYISNLMRLVELPDWAQDLIRAGELTAAHGKYILPALSSERITEGLRDKLQGEGARPSVRELQGLIYRAFHLAHTSLDGYQTPFDYKAQCVKAGCQKMRKISTETDGSTFCLDADCHKAKVKAHYDAQLAEHRARLASGGDEDGEDDDDDLDQPERTQPAAPVVREDGSIDISGQHVPWRALQHATFNLKGCDGCPNRHDAVWTNGDIHNRVDGCFDGACHAKKTKAAEEIRRRLEDATDALTRWLRTALPARIGADADAQLALIGMAIVSTDGNEFADDLWDASLEARKRTGITGIADLLEHGLLHYSEAIAEELALAGEARVLVPLAAHLGIKLTDWRADRDWLQAQSKDDLIKALLLADLHDDSDRARLDAMAADELIERALEHTDRLLTPALIREAWEHLQQESR